jgi:hypothetical protein
MATMEGFDHVLNWKLKAGSHPFPGKDGGTCINKAALVAAGFAYKPIRTVDNLPDCFARPICRFAMLLNDEERQRLRPYVTRLACADTREIESARATFIASRVTCRMSFLDRLKVLKAVLSTGRQADPYAPDVVRTRMDAVQARATTPTRVSDTPLLARLRAGSGSQE